MNNVEVSGKLFAQVAATMRSMGYKLTEQREAILRVLQENDLYLSAEDILMLVKKKVPELGVATVYRTLDLFVELEIVVKINFSDGRSRFALCDEAHRFGRYHLVCNKCGKVQNEHADWWGAFEEKLEREYGFKLTGHRLDFIGHYKGCQKKQCSSGTI